MNKAFTHPVYRTVLALFCCALWGSAFPALKIGYAQFHLASGDRGGLLLFAGSRFLTASLLIMTAGLLIRGRTFIQTDYSPGRTALVLLLLGLLQTTFQYWFFYSGVVRIPGTVSAVVNSSGVFFTLILAHFFFQDDRFSLRKGLGIFLGMGGIVLSSGIVGGDRFFSAGALFIALAALSGGAGGVLVKRISRSISPFFLTGGQMFIGSLLLLLLGALSSPSSDFRLTPLGAALFVYTALLSSAAFVIWNYLLKFNRAGEISLFLFAIPLFGTLLSHIFLHDPLSAKLIFSLLLVIGGILLVNLNSPRQKPKI